MFRFKDKGINGNPSISKEIYDKLLDQRMNEVLEMSREINFNNLIYHFLKKDLDQN